jgi:acyl-CoA thioester hydrolase
VFGMGEREAAAEGFFIHVYVGRADRRPVSLPDRWRAAFETIAVPGGAG